MESLVTIESGKVHASSQDVADKFNKSHNTILRKIKKLMETQPEFGFSNFAVTTYTTGQNKTHDCFKMSRDGFTMIAMSLTGAEAENWKIKYMAAFNKMEAALLSMAPTLETVNQIVKKAEGDKQIASECASQLAKYKQIKSSNDKAFNEAVESVQMTLGFSADISKVKL